MRRPESRSELRVILLFAAIEYTADFTGEFMCIYKRPVQETIDIVLHDELNCTRLAFLLGLTYHLLEDRRKDDVTIYGILFVII